MPLGYHIDEWCQVGWVISTAMRHSTAIRSVIYIAMDNIKIEFKRSIRFPVALHEKLTVRHDCCTVSIKCIKLDYLFIYLHFHTNYSYIRRRIKISYINAGCYIRIRFIPTYCSGIV